MGECFAVECELEVDDDDDDDDCGGDTPEEAVLFGTVELFVVLMPVALLLLLFIVALVAAAVAADGDCPLLPIPVDVEPGDLVDDDEFNAPPSIVVWPRLSVPAVPGVVGDDEDDDDDDDDAVAVDRGGVTDAAATESVVDEVADDVDANRSDFSFIILFSS